ncbi:hypothetical protein D9611_014047 [Ephemerocybe angulata]|uniref:Uncharacterized protein n=1 Tax=Ephemerocybe angulata TaxID=980116 RepID=A0A8H5ERF9_9AGAR|nr:hypothetical protein D9611_014047 [Tulosesus angulatus]
MAMVFVLKFPVQPSLASRPLAYNLVGHVRVVVPRVERRGYGLNDLDRLL